MERSGDERFWAAIEPLAAVSGAGARGRDRLLAVLAGADEPLSNRDLVRATGLAKSSVSELLEELAAAGLVDVAADPADARRRRVQLDRRAARGERARAAKVTAALAAVGEERLAAATLVLEEIGAALAGRAPTAPAVPEAVVTEAEGPAATEVPDLDGAAPEPPGEIAADAGDVLLALTSAGTVALPLALVLSVVELTGIRNVGGEVPWRLGLAETRGSIHEVFDLGARLGGAPGGGGHAVLAAGAGAPLLIAIERAVGVHRPVRPLQRVGNGDDAAITGFLDLAGEIVPLVDPRSFDNRTSAG